MGGAVRRSRRRPAALGLLLPPPPIRTIFAASSVLLFLILSQAMLLRDASTFVEASGTSIPSSSSTSAGAASVPKKALPPIAASIAPMAPSPALGTVAAGVRVGGGPFRPSAVRNFVRERCDGGGFLPAEDFDDSGSGGGVGDGSAVWVYEGSLVDPITGETVAEVEGLELVRHLSECRGEGGGGGGGRRRTTMSDGGTKRGYRRLGDLLARDMLFGDREEKEKRPTSGGATTQKKKIPSSSVSEWDYAATVLSRKLFCYRSPKDKTKEEEVDGGNAPPSSLLRSIRLHPNSPLRRIPSDQSVALYDTATTFVSRDRGREMAVLTEWPDGRWVLGTARAGPVAEGGEATAAAAGGAGGGNGLFDFSVHVRRSNTGDRPELKPVQSVGGGGGSGDVVISPPRAKLIEFGRDTNAEQHRYSARETYSYTLPASAAASASASSVPEAAFRSLGRWAGRTKWELAHKWDRITGRHHDDLDARPSRASATMPSSSEGGGASVVAFAEPTVRYSRYGECPPWYGPGRTCALELKGRRVRSVTDAPALVATLAADRVPGFAVVNAPLPTGGGDERTHRKNRRRSSAKKYKGGIGDVQRLLAQTLADDRAARAVSRFRGTARDSLPLALYDDDYEDDARVRARRKRRLAMGAGDPLGWRDRAYFAREDVARWAGRWCERVWDATRVTTAGTGGSSSSLSSGWSESDI